MKIILQIIILIAFINAAKASTYYFSSSIGDDSRQAVAAQNQNTPWSSLNKLNAVMPTLKAGDSILFKAGDTFYGNISITVSGNQNNPIVFASYGTGSKPVITGLTTLANWVSVGQGIYESYNANLGSVVNTLIMNNQVQAMGRFPNSGYATISSHNGNTSITDNSLSSSINWTGAELVVRTTHWVIDRTKITSQSGNTISYAQPLSYEPLDNFGYFIQNDIRTLDVLGEWYFNPATKKVSVYFGTQNPASYAVQVPFANNLVSIYNNSNIVINNITFKGSNQNTIDMSTASNCQIINCDILFSGTDAITGSSVTNSNIQNNNIINSNNNGVYLGYDCSTNNISKNNIKNTLMFPGLCTSGNTTGLGIFVRGKSNMISLNNIDSSGFTPIRFAEDSNIIQNNYISNFNFVKDDEGAIYTYNNNPGAPVNYGRKITGNIIINGIGAELGTDGNNSADGIYMDDNSGGVEITNNTIANCNNNGIYIHDAHDMLISNNTSFNNGNSQIILKYDNIAPNGVIRNIQNNKNIFFSKKANQMVARFQSIKNDFAQMGVYDFNYYCRPLNDNFSLLTRDMNGTEVAYDLNSWKTLYNKDAQSKVSPVAIAPYKITSIAAANKFSNETFATDINGMYVYSTATNYSATWNSGGKLDGGAFQGNINSSAPSTFSPILAIGSLSSSKQYILRFSAIANKDTVFNVYLRQSQAPYNTISDVKTFHITPSRKEYEFLFSFPATEADASIGFETPSQNLSFWLDNVKLYEATATITNPDDSIRFEYNPTNTAKSISLSKNYIDVKGNKYSGNILLQPYSSLIMLPDTSRPVVAFPSPTIRILNPLTNAIFNLNADVLISTICAAGTDDGSIQKVEFYNGNVLLGSVSKAPFNLTVHQLPVGTYTLTAKATDNNGMVATSAPVQIFIRSLGIAPASINNEASISDATIKPVVKVAIGPNPCLNVLNIDISGFDNNKPMGVKIFSTSGIEVASFQSNTNKMHSSLDVSRLAGGMYILRISEGNTLITKQFIKQ